MMVWATLLVGAGAFLVLRVRGSSPLNSLLSAIGLVAVLGAVAISQEGWEVPAPVLILVGAIGGSLAATAAERELHAARETRSRRPT